MSEIVNNKVFATDKKFVDFEGLDYFWEKAKGYIDGHDDTISADVKELQDAMDALGAEEGGIQDMIDTSIEDLNIGQYATTTSVNTSLEAMTELINSIEVKYDKDNKVIYLSDSTGNTSGFDASEFVVDGILDSVDFEMVPVLGENGEPVTGDDGQPIMTRTNNLVFVFNADGKKESISVDFSKYIDTYKADGSSIELDSTTNTFAVKEVAASKTKLGQKITIAGGPLANDVTESGEVWPEAWTTKVNGVVTERFIPENATMYDIVKNLFCVEKWPVKANGTSNISTSDATLTSSVAAPTLTYNGKTSGSSTVEVGSTVNYSASCGASSYTATPHTASGFTYGYADANDGSKDSSNASVSATFNGADGKTTVKVTTDSAATLTLSGVVEDTITGTAESAAAGAASTSGSVVIAAGDNKITAQSTSVTYDGTCTALPVYYGCSNLGATAKEDGTTYPSTAKDEISKTSVAVNSSEVVVNCIGDYKVFVGYIDTNPSLSPLSSTDVRALNNNSRIGKGRCGDKDTLFTITKNFMVVAVPTGWDFDIQNSMSQDAQRDSYEKVGSVDVELPNHTAEVPSTQAYDIWCIGWKNGAYKNLVIK